MSAIHGMVFPLASDTSYRVPHFDFQCVHMYVHVVIADL